MPIHGVQFARVHRALLSAFPTRSELELFVRVSLGVNLSEITRSENLTTVVYDLLQWAEAQGRLVDLIIGAKASVPGNGDLAVVEQGILYTDDRGEWKVSKAPIGPSSQSSADPLTRTMTCVESGVAHFVLTETGEFAGGQEALRRAVVDILGGRWNGEIRVHHAFLKKIEQEIRDLDSKSGLTKEEAERLVRSRSQANFAISCIDALRLAMRLTFYLTPGELGWGVPMDTERALGFIVGLFAELVLTPRSLEGVIRCRLYVPDRWDDPVAIDIYLSENEVRDIRKSWVSRLEAYDKMRLRVGEWSGRVPLWHLQDAVIAIRLLPAIAATLIARAHLGDFSTDRDSWEQVRKHYTDGKRNVLSPYHWCLALESDRSAKDLTWDGSPPSMESELLSALGVKN